MTTQTLRANPAPNVQNVRMETRATLRRVLVEQHGFLTDDDTPVLLADPATFDLAVLIRQNVSRVVLPMFAVMGYVAGVDAQGEQADARGTFHDDYIRDVSIPAGTCDYLRDAGLTR